MIYFDQAATTKPCTQAISICKQGLDVYWHNPSASYSLGADVRQKVEEAREIIAKSINALPNEIFFTSGSTEAINWFCRCLGYATVCTTEIEHHAVLNSIKNKKFIPLDEETIICCDKLPRAQILITSLINNEIGTICPVKDFRKKQMVIFLDATQAYGHIPIDVKELGVSFLTTSAHKFHGLKGCGFLYISTEMQEAFLAEKRYAMQRGGGQEMGFRAGTENVLGILVMAAAAKKSLEDRETKNKSIQTIRNYLVETLRTIPCAHLNGTSDWSKRWCGNLNYRFNGYKGEELQSWFDMNGIMVSTGSACNSHENAPSHVLKAIGLTDEQANSSIRLTFDETNNLDEAKEFIKVLKKGLEVLQHD